MTKQEQIVEMTQIICGSCKDGICLIDKTSCTRDCSNKSLEESEVLYNAGYRKASEARNETTKEIIEKILSYLGSNQKFIIAEEKHSVWVDCEKLFAYLEKVGNEYGVEWNNG